VLFLTRSQLPTKPRQQLIRTMILKFKCWWCIEDQWKNVLHTVSTMVATNVSVKV